MSFPLSPSPIPPAPPPRFSLADLRRARTGKGNPVPVLTCYDYSTALQMNAAGVPALLVGDTASTVVLGHPGTVPVTLEFLMELARGVRRGHPSAYLMFDMPFGSYHQSTAQGMRNLCKVLKRCECDAVKLEVAPSHLPLIRRATDAGIAVVAHLGLRPQAVQVLGGYRAQGRTPHDADAIVALARDCEAAGAVALLIEAVPSATTRRIADATSVPIIGCGAGPAAHAHVIVTNDLLGLTPRRPRFVPTPSAAPAGSDIAAALRHAFSWWVGAVESRAYPAPEHEYAMASV